MAKLKYTNRRLEIKKQDQYHKLESNSDEDKKKKFFNRI